MMKKMIRAFAGILLCFGTMTPVYAENADDPAFDEWLDRQFRESVEQDYTSMHFYVRHWKEAGLTKPEINFGEAGLDSYDEAIVECQKTLDELQAFDYDKLSVRQQHDYDAMLFSQTSVMKLNEYPMLAFAFDPSNNIVDNLHTNLTEFVFYEEEDFDDYLTLLKTAPDFLDQIMELTKQQAAEGYFLIDSALDQTLSEIDKFTENKTNNPLVAVFNNNVEAFDGLSSSKKEQLKKDNEEYVLNTYIPYVENLRAELESLRGSRKGGDSYADLKDGKEYYAAYLKYCTGLDRTPEEILEIGTKYIKNLLPSYIVMITAADDAVTEEQVAFKDAEEILNYLKQHLSDYPEIPETSFTVSYLDPSLASDSIGAYYMVPPVDDYGNNVIKVNGSNVDDMNNLYYYLAHEGYPGHLFAHTWCHEDGEKPVRQLLSFLGYGEGWAMYTSGQMWKESGLSPQAAELNRLDWDLNYVLMAVADIGVNAIGWSVKELGDYLDRLGLNSSAAQDLYDNACMTPGSLVPYGIGLAFMDTLRENTEAQLGSAFDPVEYHEAVLRYSERPLDLLEKDIQAYLESKDIAYDPNAADSTEPAETADSGSGSLILIGAAAAAAVILGTIIILRSRNKREDPFGA